MGDDAMLYALLQELHVLNLKAIFAVLSPIPIIVPSEVEDRTKYIKPTLFAVGKEILKSSVIVVGGGTHLFDYGNKINALKIQLRIFLLVLYSKLLTKKVYLLGNGLGPLQTTWGKFLVRLICFMADYISVRDRASYKFLRGWRFTDKASLAFDLSVLIEPLSETESATIKSGKNNLGISVTPVFELYYGSKERDVLLVAEISKHLNAWLKREPQAEVCLFIFHGQSRDDDISITRLLQEKLQPSERVKLIPYDSDPRMVLAKVGQCGAFIGMKYHSSIFAYINDVPLLIIDYHPKCRAFAEEVELPKHAVISPEEILTGQFEKYLKNLQEHPDDFVAKLSINEAKQMAKKGLPKIGIT